MEIILTISTICLWVVVLFNLFLTFALIRRLNAKGNSIGEQRPFVDLPKGTKAPDFIAQNLSGETVTLASFVGRKIAFIFIATYCVPCKELLPKVIALKEKASRAGVEIVLISIEERDVTRRYLEENAISFPVLIAPRKTSTFMENYKIAGTPSFCFITAQGTVYDADIPHFDGEKWAAFEDFLAEEANFVEAGGGDTEEVRLH